MTDLREYPSRPVCGVGVVVWNGNRVLLVQRGKPPRAGQWALPGGAQELGETLFEAARREVWEETAVDIEPQQVITAIDLIECDSAGIRFHYTLVEVVARYVGGQAAAADDAARAAWFDPGEIASLDAWDEVARVVAMSRP